MTQAERVSQARARLLIDSPWLGALALRLTVQPDTKTKTWETDGTCLYYNPEWTADHDDSTLKTLWAHETYHCALLHPFRIRNRQLAKFNRAADYAINLFLLDAGFALPAGALVDSKYASMTAEQIYAAMGDDPEPPPSGGSKPQPQPGDFTAPSDPQPGNGDSSSDNAPGQSKPIPLDADDWTEAAEQATLVCERQGNMPGSLARAIRQTHKARTPWYELLRDFVIHTVPSDYSMSRPNRQYAARGLFVPGLVKENAPAFVLGVDTSGSISQEMLDSVASEIQGLVREVQPESLTVIYCDACVQAVETFSPDDDIKLTVHGGGGTRFQPVFDHVATMDEPPAALIYFTDLYGPPPTEPDYPVMWLVPEQISNHGPFGTTVPFSLHE